MSSLLEVIKGKQKDGKTIHIFFRNSPSVYIKPVDTVEALSDDFYNIILKDPIRQSDNGIYNIKNIIKIVDVSRGVSDD